MRYFLLLFILFTSLLHAEEIPEFNASSQIFNMIFSLVGLLVGVFLISFFFKKMMHKRIQIANDQGLIKILERRALNPKSSLYVIEVMGKTMIVGESAQGLHTIGSIEDPDLTKVIPPPKPKAVKFSFAAILKNLNNRKSNDPSLN